MCLVCKHKRVEEIDGLLDSGVSPENIAVRYSLVGRTVARHREHRIADRKKFIEANPPPELPTLEGDVSPRDKAATHVSWLESKIKWSESNGGSTRELSQLSGQYTSALKNLARLSGALDITEMQILRSAPWTRIMSVVRDVLKRHPLVLAEVVAALESLEETGK